MRFLVFLLIVVLYGCGEREPEKRPLFTEVTEESGINFRNDLSITKDLNPYTYRNFYNGAGVAIGDINNDGLQDIYFAGNQVDNRLYLNLGNFRFKDISNEAGVTSPGSWSTGVTFADVNGDGYLDIYVCKSGDPKGANRHNALFINNKDLTFSERANEYGLDVVGLSVQAAFFDFDRDSDLDCYLLTNSFKPVGNFDLVKDQRNIPDPLGGGNKFFRNDDGKFTDITAQAGIFSSSIGFGLGITLGDLNDDGWTDIFVSNDFFERDYLYINNKNGSFAESLPEYFHSISMGSMGADYADLDRDGRPELFVTEMLPDSLSRKKTKTIYESWNKYQMNLENGYYRQFSRNVLQKRIAENEFVEVGRLAGLSASEWSWGALLFDMDNDGYRDVFIANGIYKDLLDRDYLAYSSSEENVRKLLRANDDNTILKIFDLMPATPVPNYAFANKGGLQFGNVSHSWGLDDLVCSSGSAYADFDNDGDLDLILNNINAPSAIYRNNGRPGRNSIEISLSMDGMNLFAVGAEVAAYLNGKIYHADNFVTRGFQSSVSPVITLGLGTDIRAVDSLVIKWPDGDWSIQYKLAANTLHNIRKSETKTIQKRSFIMPVRQPLTFEKVRGSFFRHAGCGLVDFNRDRMLPMMYSDETPSFSKADIDQDGVSEIFIGGGKGQPGEILKFDGRTFTQIGAQSLKEFALSEKTKSTFADVDGDGDQDLYLATGGRFFPATSSALADQVLLNNGQGVFYPSPHALPFQKFISTSVVKALDFDRDGDVDFVVGERFDPFAYGKGGRGYLLSNDGSGKFVDVTAKYAPALISVGMITDMEICDLDSDDWPDIVIVGDWMPITFLENQRQHFNDVTESYNVSGTRGWWKDIAAGDFNGDARVDFVVGNYGLNSFFTNGDRMYVGDFDKNGSIEQIFCTQVAGKYYPIADREDLLAQLPSLKKQLLFYRDYSKKTIDDLITISASPDHDILQVDILESILLLSDSMGYRRIPMPLEAQYSPVYALHVSDIDRDGVLDIVAAGNHYNVKPQFGIQDASLGWFFKGAMNAENYSLARGISLSVSGQVRDIEEFEIDDNKYLLFAKNDEQIEIIKFYP